MAQAPREMASRHTHRIQLTEAQLKYIFELASNDRQVTNSVDQDLAISVYNKFGSVLAKIEYGVKAPDYTRQIPHATQVLDSLGGIDGSTLEVMTPEEEEAFFKEAHDNSVRLQEELDAAKEETNL